MKDIKQISWLAILLIVVLRISIGWQFLYEGMWKYDQMNGPKPWSAEGFLKNSQGPYRDKFRAMVGDPDELGWLDYEQMSKKCYDWRDRFVTHYKLNDEQKTLLNIMIDSSAEEDTAAGELPPPLTFSRKLDQLPEPLARIASSGDSVLSTLTHHAVTYDEDKKLLKVLRPVRPSEESKIKKLVDVVASGDKEVPYIKKPVLDAEGKPGPKIPADEVELNFFRAFDSLVKYSRIPIERQIGDLSNAVKKKDSVIDADNFNYASSRINSKVKKALPYRHRLASSLLGDPDRVGVYGALNERGSLEFEMGTVLRSEESGEKHNIRFGEIEEYKKLLEEYEQTLTQASMDYQYDHATMLNRKVATLRAKLTGPIKAMESDLKDNSIKILTSEQLALGSMKPADTPLHRSNMMAMWGLLILGSLLIVGFFSRLAAILGAVMVLSFYLVIPPWPGVPPAPGPEHSLYINKNMIEVIALLGIAALPTGTWFGIDAFFSRMFFGSRSENSKK